MGTYAVVKTIRRLKQNSCSSLTLVLGPKTVTLRCTLKEIPVFVKAGAVISCCSPLTCAGELPSELQLIAFPFCSDSSITSESSVYEDDGSTTEYIRLNEYSNIITRHIQTGSTASIDVLRPTGHFKGMASTRRFKCVFRCCWPPNGATINKQEHTFSYDASSFSATVEFQADWDTNAVYSVEILQSSKPASNTRLCQGMPALMQRALAIKNIVDINQFYPRYSWPDAIFRISCAGTLLRASQYDAKRLLECLEYLETQAETAYHTLTKEDLCDEMKHAAPLLALEGELESQYLFVESKAPAQITHTPKTEPKQDNCHVM